MRETLLLFIVLTEYCSSSCLFCPVLSSLMLTLHPVIMTPSRFQCTNSQCQMYTTTSVNIVKSLNCRMNIFGIEMMMLKLTLNISDWSPAKTKLMLR